LDKRAHDPQPHIHRELEYREEANRNAKPKHPKPDLCRAKPCSFKGRVVGQFETPFTMPIPQHTTVWVLIADIVQ